MQHVRLAFVNARLLAEDEAKALKLRSLYRAPPQEEWRRSLYQAADILENLGWCRSSLERGRRHCAVGAILAAFNEGEVEEEGTADSGLLQEPGVKWMVDRVTSHLAHLTDSGALGLMGWNDSDARSGKEVAALLRTAAAPN
jgi:hypothetical protein